MMGAGMSRVLVAYATKSGSATEIAQRIGAKLAEAGATVDVKPAGDAPDPSAYDAVVVGSGVRVGSWHAPAKEWMTANAETLKAMPVAFFTVGLTITEEGKEDEVRAYTDPLVESTGVKPVALGLFAGWFEPKKFGFMERTIMKAMKAPAGDHRDFPAIEAWAADVAAPALGIKA